MLKFFFSRRFNIVVVFLAGILIGVYETQDWLSALLFLIFATIVSSLGEILLDRKEQLK